jgi:hypothetical protein
MRKSTRPLFSAIGKQLIFVCIILCTSLAFVTIAAALDGAYLLVRDSDGTVPKKDAVVILTFKGGNAGTLSLSAVQPGETVTDTGTFSLSGKRITIQFKEMELAATRQQYYTEGCYLILPFKALAGSEGPGTSLWTRNSDDCKGRGSPAKDSPIMAQLQTMATDLNNQQQADIADKKGADTGPSSTTEIPLGGPATGKPSCIDCTYGRCIQELIAQKKAFIEMYKEIGKEYADLYLAADNKGRLSPAVTVDKKGFMPALPQYNKNMEEWQKKRDLMSEDVMAKNPIPSCHISGGEIGTNSIECRIDLEALDKFAAAVPCREISEIANQHEVYHLTQCQERKKNDKLPTPYGLSMEEVKTHQLEIGMLTKLLEKIKKTPKGCWRCGKTQVIYFDKAECNEKCPDVRLKGSLVFKCFKLNEKGKHIMKIGDQF